MKLTLGARLTLSYLAVILAGMSIVTPLAWLGVEKLYLETQTASLLAQARQEAAALSFETTPEDISVPYSQTTNALPGIHTRVIDTQGSVVIDFSSINPDGPPLPSQNAIGVISPQDLLERPEIIQAQFGQAATAVRRVEAAGGRQVLYAAAPVLSGSGQVIRIVYLATPLPDTRLSALPFSLRLQASAVVLAAVLLAGALGMWWARRISRPLDELANAARAVAGGKLDHKVPEDPALPELAVLGQAFNRMTASLMQADQAKTAFISDVNHELRTPLTVIKGTIETLQDGAIDDLEARGPFLEAMNRETERLIRLVNDLLVLTRADAGALNLHKQPLNLAELARTRCQHFSQTAHRRQVQLVVENSEQSGSPLTAFMIEGDADRLAQVMDNLLDNALRYAPPGSRVTVRLSREAKLVKCCVCDQGPGISARHLPLIFERFYRADASRVRGQGGSGLGLSIVRSLVQAHGGSVEARSVEGQGTDLVFYLPAEK